MIEKLANSKWRLENLYKIATKQSTLEICKPNEVQNIIRASSAKRKITLKARQFGITTDAVLRRFDSCIWSRNKTVCILAHKQEVLDKIFNIVKVAYKNMPEQLRPELDKGGGSKYEYHFPKLNSTIYTTLEVRGGTIHELHVSEAAFIPIERINATLQAVPIDGIVEFESTANGLNHFYDLWRQDEDGYSRFFFPWFFHGEYRIPVAGPLDLTDDESLLLAFARSRFNLTLSHDQIAFRRYKIKEFNNSTQKFLQEYPEDDQGCFLSTGNNPFDSVKLHENAQKVPSVYTIKDQIRIYNQPEKNKTYVIGADVAEGVRRDYSVASCFCVEDKREVAYYRGHIKPEDFAEILHSIGQMYSHPGKWPELIVERNNHGHAVILKLNQVLNYPNLWCAPDDRIGHPTTSITRPLLIDTFIEAVDSAIFEIRSKETYAECMTLVDNNGKIEAEDGKHDDSVIATALAIKLVLERLPKVNFYKNIETRIFV